MGAAITREQLAAMMAALAGEPATPAIDLRRLAEPFAPDVVSWRVGSTTSDKSRGMALAYIDARDVQDRLDAVVGPENWRDEYQEIGGFFICKLWIKVDGEWTWKCDGAGKTDVEGEKGMVSDSFKRAAVKWGIGRYLYNLDSPWVPLKAIGKSFAIADEGKDTLRKLLQRHSAHYHRGAEDTTRQPPARHEPALPAAAAAPAPAPKAAAAAPSKPAGYITQPEKEATAAMLLDGMPDREGLRAITRRVQAAYKSLESGKPLPPGYADTATPAAINDAYDAWESWKRAVRPLLSEADTATVIKAMEFTAKELKRLDAAVKKAERAAAAKAEGADPETGVMQYEPEGAVA